MAAVNEARRARLLAMVEEDKRVRAELASSGELFGHYHPRMEAVHVTNANELGAMLDHSWPAVSEVGEDGQSAAWLIAQHAISLPPFQRQCLTLLHDAVARGEAPGWHLATLTDRVRALEGRPQLYGTQFDWDGNGEVSPLPIEEASRVDERRAQVGLEPIAITTARHRREAQASGERPPAHRAKYLAEQDEWARRVGWR